jgi:hypothetical protein
VARIAFLWLFRETQRIFSFATVHGLRFAAAWYGHR